MRRILVSVFAAIRVENKLWVSMKLKTKQTGQHMIIIAGLKISAARKKVGLHGYIRSCILKQSGHTSTCRFVSSDDGSDGRGIWLAKKCFLRCRCDGRKDVLTKQWYIDVLARIRINAFRIELVGGSYEDLLLSASSSVNADAAVGSAIYMLPSFYNHDCDPNAHVLWIENVNARVKALRDIEAGEELRICYIDASMDYKARQNLLSQGFGFQCHCLRCLSND